MLTVRQHVALVVPCIRFYFKVPLSDEVVFAIQFCELCRPVQDFLNEF